MALLVIGFIEMITDFGLAAAIVQKKSVSDEDYSSCFWALLILSVFLVISLSLFSNVYPLIFNDDRVEELILALAITVLFLPIHVVYKAILARNYRLDTLSKIELLSLAIRSVVVIVLAVSGFGVWSIIIGFIVDRVIVSLLLLVFVHWLPMKNLQLTRVKGFLEFGLNITYSRVIYYGLFRVDSFLVGRLFGAEILGMYAIATQFVGVVTQLLINAGTRVLFPVFAKYQDSPLLNSYLYRAIQLIAVVGIPAICGIGLVAEDLIKLTIGDSWSQAVGYLRVLAVVACFQVLTFIIPLVLNAIRRPEVNTKVNFACLIVYSIVIYLSARIWGVDGVLISCAVLWGVRFLLILGIAWRLLKINIKAIAEDLFKVACATAVLVLSVIYISAAIGDYSSIVRLTIMAVTGAAVYALAAFVLFGKQFAAIYRVLVDS